LLFVPAHVLPLWTRPPALVTVHDLGYRYFPEAHPLGQRWYLEWSTRHNARRATIILADSEATRADLIRHYGTDPDRIVVAYPGLDPTLAPARDPQRIARTLARYGIRRPYLLYLGTLQPRKNLVRLVEAFARLQSRLDPDDRGLSLVLAGRRGWLYDGLFRRVRTLGLEGRVLFPGYVDDADKAALLSGALAFVFPSLYEGFGFPVLEAQVCGTPVVCSDRSSLPEVAGDAALLVDPMDVEALAAALYRVVTEPGLRATLIERGWANVRRFSWESCAQAVLEVMGRVLDEERRAKAT
ncbi:MAG TPA: glycosyltransferase family 1 protein, partial [Chloroflexi bacterium]|nr:glycosyltransferase family 1 protein [Chloroflexota bacterium]